MTKANDLVLPETSARPVARTVMLGMVACSILTGLACAGLALSFGLTIWSAILGYVVAGLVSVLALAVFSLTSSE